MINIQLSDTPLSADECIELVKNNAVGGIAVFIGTVRDQTKGKPVVRLEFEAYAPMAVKEMQKIAEKITKKFEAINVVIHHRTGILDIKDTAVVIAVATPHRKAAFEACQYAIDTLKDTVPIWKKEMFKDGEIWVAAHP